MSGTRYSSQLESQLNKDSTIKQREKPARRHQITSAMHQRTVFSPFPEANLGGYDAASEAEGLGVKRRKFLAIVCGATVWPLAARAQPKDRTRVVGILIGPGND